METASAGPVARASAWKRTLAALADRIPIGWGGQEAGRFFSRVLSPAPPVAIVLGREIRIGGVVCAMKLDVGRWSGNELFVLGRHYEPQGMASWVRACREADAALDVGANAGLYTVLALAASPRLSAVAIEPDPANLRLLAANTGEMGRVRVLAGCLVPEGVKAGVWTETPASGGYAFREGPISAVAAAPSPRLYSPADVRAALGEAAKVAVKLDVEGGESALLGAASFWQEIRPWALLVEITAPDAGAEQAAIAAALAAAADCGLSYVARRLESLLSLSWLRRERLANWLLERREPSPCP